MPSPSVVADALVSPGRCHRGAGDGQAVERDLPEIVRCQERGRLAHREQHTKSQTVARINIGIL
jgi:hypothetical protein